MTDPFVGEIRAVGFNFAPTGWALCNGQLLPISQNTALFSLLGTNYGGNGQTTFALPNLQGASPIGQGQGQGLSSYDLGQQGGSKSVTLLSAEMPSHSHVAQAVAALGTTSTPNQNAWAEPRYGRAAERNYAATSNTTMHPQSIGVAGGNLPHNNMPPYLVVNYIIAMQGIFPPRP
ncbi:phage tail protein [Luethyella okanaganae]|uniref:Phage tail protein n=1 Tax=Luethyella okanaganae TaxID=69372 RepID=A0ABW1VFS7_9MICO